MQAFETLERRQLLALVVNALPAEQVTHHSATIGAEIVDQGGPAPELTLYWGDEDGGPVANGWDHVFHFRTSPVGKYTTELTGLDVATTYYYRAFALSLFGGGVVWTDAASFTTLAPAAATVSADPVRHVSATTVDLSGLVSDDGGQTPNIEVYFGETNGGENADAWQHRVDLGPQAGAFEARLTTLLPSKSYYVRLAAANAGGRSWTPVQSFTTLAAPPLQISEFMAANGTIATTRIRSTPDGEFPRSAKAYDWIELQNNTSAPQDVSGYWLSDDRQTPLKWQFPAGTVVPAHGHLVVYASGEDILDPNLDEQGRLHTNFQLSSDGEYLGLFDPQGNMVSEVDTDLAQYRDVSFGNFGPAWGHMRGATPGAANEPLGAAITDVRHQWEATPESSGLLVMARVATAYDSLEDVTLTYRVMYGGEVSLPMTDDGQGADWQAGDGMYMALIPPDVATPGQMIRYYVTARLSNGLLRREPLFVDPQASPEYFGTIVNDPSLESNLPVLHRFIEEPRRADTARGTRASVVYDGELYDNVFIRIRGGTAVNWPKKSYKVEFNDDHHFLLNPDAPRVDEVNINATYTDKSYVRARLTSEFQLDVGQPSPETYHIRMHENGEFFSVALMVEQPDRDFLRRHGLDPEGSLYKGGPGSYYTRNSLGAFEKKTRDDEDKSDLTALLEGLQLRDDELERFLFDHVDLAAQINFMATHVITQNIDASDKNHYLYRDTNGTGQWRMLPWDLDLVFGPDALNTDYIAADENTRGATYPNAVHPLLGSRQFPLHDGKINMLLDAVITSPRTREMFLRRVRTLADEYLATGYFHERIDQLVALLQDDVADDRAKWRSQSHFGGTAPPIETAAERIKTQYLDRRLPYLTEYHVQGGVGIPERQPDDVTLQLSDVQFHPESGGAGDEYFAIVNPNAFAVDVSGWQITGSLAHTIAPGTVIAAGDSLYLTRSVAGFLQRSDSPKGGEGRLVQQYATELPDSGGQLRLLNRAGVAVSETEFGTPAVPADAGNLRISEIHYHPRDGVPEWGELVAGGSNFEFVELTNISAQPIELAGVRFQPVTINADEQGIAFTFDSQILPAGESLVVVRSVAAFESRYGTLIPIALGNDGQEGRPGEFGNGLGNSGETITLVDAQGATIQQLSYTDEGAWSARADGAGSSLEWIGGTDDPSDPSAWRASDRFGGTPGAVNDVLPRDVVINEIRNNGDGALGDAVELFNIADVPIDISGWYLSDSANDPFRYQFPPETVLPPGGYLALEERQFGFGLRGTTEDDLYLLAVDSTGRPARFADYVQFGGTVRNSSIGRYPDGQGTLRPLTTPTFGQANAPPTGGVVGDFNADGVANGSDLALLCAAIHALDGDTRFDLTADGRLDHEDLDAMVHDILHTVYGDANLDGRFDSSDLQSALQSGGYEHSAAASADWSSGDWNCDGQFTTADLVLAFADGGFE